MTLHRRERDFFRLKPATRHGEQALGKVIVCRLHNRRTALKPGFNGRHNHFYSSSCLRLEHGVFFVRARAISEKELLAQVQCLCLYLHRLVVTGRRRRYGAGGMADGAQRAGYNDCGNRINVRQSSRRSWRATKQARKLAGFQNKL